MMMTMLPTRGGRLAAASEVAGGAVRQPDNVRQRVEDSLDAFLSRLPAWRAGQRDVGQTVVSESPERASRSGSRKKHRRDKDRSRSKSRGRRPSPVPVPSKRGSMFDVGPHKALPAPPKEESKKKKDKKDKDRDRDRDKRDKDKDRSRSGSRSRSRGRRKDRKDSSASPPAKKKKDKDRKKDKEKEKEKDRDKEDGSRSRSRSGSRARRKDRSADKAEGDGAGAPAADAGASVPDWLSDLVGGGGAQAGGARPRPSRREVMVPQQMVARLIGRGGEVITGICNATGADVKIRQETKDMGYSLAVIMGHPDAMEKAEILVRQKLGLAPGGVATKEIPIPAEHVGAVIGPKGATIAEIRAMAGGMPVEVRPPDVPGMPHRAFLGPGQPEQMAIVEQLLTGKIAEAALARHPL